MYKLENNPRAAGQILYAAKDLINVRGDYSTDGRILTQVRRGVRMSRTGRFATAAGQYNWYEVGVNNVTGWVRSDVASPRSTATKQAGPPVPTDGADVNQVLANVLRNDRYTYHNLLAIREMLERNPATPAVLQGRYRLYLASYNTRQNKLRNSRQIKNATLGRAATGWEWLQQKWSGMVGGGMVGALPAVALYIGAALIVAGVGGLLYEWLKPEEKKSFDDFQGSDDLKKQIYALLPPAQAEDLVKQVAKVSEDAYKEGKSDGGGFSATARNIGLAAAGLGAAFLFFNKKRKTDSR